MNLKRIVLAGAAISALIFSTGCSSPKQASVVSAIAVPQAPAPAPTPAPAVAQTPAPAPAAVADGDADANPHQGRTGHAAHEFRRHHLAGLTRVLPRGRRCSGVPTSQITGTTEPDVYRSRLYSMTSFSWPLPNGKYTVKLHFCETYDGITGPGQRVFSFTVQGREFKDLDLFAKVGALHAYIETVPVEITGRQAGHHVHAEHRESADLRH